MKVVRCCCSKTFFLFPRFGFYLRSFLAPLPGEPTTMSTASRWQAPFSKYFISLPFILDIYITYILHLHISPATSSILKICDLPLSQNKLVFGQGGGGGRGTRQQQQRKMQRRVVAGLGQRKPYGTFSGGILERIRYSLERLLDTKIRMHTTATRSRR